MTDQCKHCSVRGDIEECLSTECSHHENWISAQHKTRHEALLAQVEEMRMAHSQRLYTMTNEDVDAIFDKAPQQSLDSLKARIEEETIDRCARFAEGCDKSTHPTDLGDGLIHMHRKYQPSTKADK